MAGNHSTVDPCEPTILRPLGSNPKHIIRAFSIFIAAIYTKFLFGL